jgi:hypothetical protein
MSKTLITIPEGNLLRVAATKSITTLTALREKTRVDRKTLRAINAGQPVKETTLQTIADRLHVPLPHLLGPDTADGRENISGIGADADGYREIKLRRLDAAALRELAGETGDEIGWFLKIDQMSDELEAVMLKLGKCIRGWCSHILTIEDPGLDNLPNQISQIKTSAGIDRCVEELSQHKLKIFGGTYVCWNSEQLRHQVEDYPLPVLRYTSQLRAALIIAPDDKNTSTIRVWTGREPPQKFDESKLAGIDFVEVNRETVWFRENF